MANPSTGSSKEKRDPGRRLTVCYPRHQGGFKTARGVEATQIMRLSRGTAQEPGQGVFVESDTTVLGL